MRQLAAGAFVLLGVSVTGCDDVVRKPLSPMAPQSVQRPGAPMTKEQFHAQQWDVVGPLHNANLAAFANELRHPSKTPKPLCTAIIDFLTERAKMAPGAATLSKSERQAHALKVVRSSELCAPRPRTPVVRKSSLTRTVPSDVYDYYGQLSSAVDNATSSSALAGTLGSIVSAAQGELNSDEAAVIEASASVAQSSYEYWESEVDSYAQAVSYNLSDCYSTSGGSPLIPDENVAADCISDLYSSIESLEAPKPSRPYTLTAASLPYRRNAAPRRSGSVMFASARVTPPAALCGTSISNGFKAIGAADLGGAFMGAWTGIGGGPAGIIAGAILEGSGASIVVAVGLAVEAWLCWWRS